MLCNTKFQFFIVLFFKNYAIVPNQYLTISLIASSWLEDSAIKGVIFIVLSTNFLPTFWKNVQIISWAKNLQGNVFSAPCRQIQTGNSESAQTNNLGAVEREMKLQEGEMNVLVNLYVVEGPDVNLKAKQIML